VQEFRD
jgi:hypothetical protein